MATQTKNALEGFIDDGCRRQLSGNDLDFIQGVHVSGARTDNHVTPEERARLLTIPFFLDGIRREVRRVQGENRYVNPEYVVSLWEESTLYVVPDALEQRSEDGLWVISGKDDGTGTLTLNQEHKLMWQIIGLVSQDLTTVGISQIGDGFEEGDSWDSTVEAGQLLENLTLPLSKEAMNRLKAGGSFTIYRT